MALEGYYPGRPVRTKILESPTIGTAEEIRNRKSGRGIVIRRAPKQYRDEYVFVAHYINGIPKVAVYRTSELTG